MPNLSLERGPPPAWHLAREAVVLIIGLAGQAPSRLRPLSSNVRPHEMHHLLAALEGALESKNHYAALALALTLPDIIGWVRDPSAGSRQRCVRWFEEYLQPLYIRPARSGQYPAPEHNFLSGSDFYALRCAYLHEGRDDIVNQRARDILEDFQFVVPPDGWQIHRNQSNSTLQLQLDVFCREIATGIQACLKDLAVKLQ